MGRPEIPEKQKIVTRQVGATDKEWNAVRAIAKAKNFKTPMDLFRELLRMQDHKLGRGVFREPSLRAVAEG